MPRAKGTKAAVDVAVDVLPKRRMRHVKTKEECRLGNETLEVWSVELPSKHAENILRVIKDNIPGQDSIDLQHLRRFARPKYMPARVLGQRDLVKEMHTVPRTWENATSSTVMQSPGSTKWDAADPAKKTAINTRTPTLYLLVCPAHCINLPELYDMLKKESPFTSASDSWAFPLEIKKVTVPRQPPTNPEQAVAWSAQYWPTFYRKTNPFGAHPATIAKAESDVKHPLIGNLGIEEGLALAEQAAEETTQQGYGVKTGCVIVERVNDKTQVIAAAGDARHKSMNPGETADSNTQSSTACSISGNPMCHAVMRAVGMVGRKRLRVASHPMAKTADRGEKALMKAGLNLDQRAHDAFFLDQPVNDFEEQFFRRDNLKPDGYLCLKLEVFLTHEPCVMCSMALVHSRVGRVFFRERMPRTGGLTAEVTSNDTGAAGLGYGLCWRKELNWQFMCWEYALEEPLKATTTTSPTTTPIEPAAARSALPVAPRGGGGGKKKKNKGGCFGRDRAAEKSSTLPSDPSSSTDEGNASGKTSCANPCVSSSASVHV
ncbi:hypothetical protein B0A48_15508 [Cryoendolithus antarcticus]|uniref:CMP/dCMP-type deaminase domain-containing protein n=1 Tax=Cryoendolithus antarcticus TaxID=1507870 RepID=A0A1V8SGE1_9PEZI|nr:hypothetical protein B0A48_15508 [Cryoendolithus antarcticus]